MNELTSNNNINNKSDLIRIWNLSRCPRITVFINWIKAHSCKHGRCKEGRQTQYVDDCSTGKITGQMNASWIHTQYFNYLSYSGRQNIRTSSIRLRPTPWHESPSCRRWISEAEPGLCRRQLTQRRFLPQLWSIKCVFSKGQCQSWWVDADAKCKCSLHIRIYMSIHLTTAHKSSPPPTPHSLNPRILTQ